MSKKEETAKIHELLEEIYRVKKQKVLEVEKLAEKIDALIALEGKARDELQKATTNLQIRKWSAVIKSIATEKILLQEKRYLFKLLELEEGKLRERLAILELEE